MGARPFTSRWGFDISVDFDRVQLRARDRRWFLRLFRLIGVLAEVGPGDVHVAIVRDAAMRRLHRTYLRQDSTTDVLTFDMRDAPEEPIHGDVVVNLDEAQRQARKRGHDLRLELMLYAVHGLLHLQGYDDRTEEDAAEMHLREDTLFKAAGLPAIYHSQPPG